MTKANEFQGQIKPLPGYIVGEKVELQNKTASGFDMPDTAKDKERPVAGKVVACGEKRYNRDGIYTTCPVSVGQTVVYKKYSNQEIKINGKEYQMVEFRDVMGIVEEDKNV